MFYSSGLYNSYYLLKKETVQVRFNRKYFTISVTDVAMPVRAVCKTSLSWPQKEALWWLTLEAVAFGVTWCNPPPAPESRVRDPLRRAVAVCGLGGVTYSCACCVFTGSLKAFGNWALSFEVLASMFYYSIVESCTNVEYVLNALSQIPVQIHLTKETKTWSFRSLLDQWTDRAEILYFVWFHCCILNLPIITCLANVQLTKCCTHLTHFLKKRAIIDLLLKLPKVNWTAPESIQHYMRNNIMIQAWNELQKEKLVNF